MSNILFLITHFSLKRQTFRNDKMRSHERLENTVNQMLFFFFFPFFLKLICFELYSLFYGTPTNVQDEQSLIERYWKLTLNSACRLEQTNQWLAPTFQWKQICNYERMMDKDVKFISFSIVTVVYKLENPDESLETSNNIFQNCPMCGVVCQC